MEDSFDAFSYKCHGVQWNRMYPVHRYECGLMHELRDWRSCIKSSDNTYGNK